MSTEEENRKYVGIALQQWTNGKETFETSAVIKEIEGIRRVGFRSLGSEEWVLFSIEVLVRSYKPLPSEYAVGVVLDQTFGYLTQDGSSTIHHPEALLLNSVEEAKKWKKKYKGDFIEAVPDVQEFRSREDTW